MTAAADAVAMTAAPVPESVGVALILEGQLPPFEGRVRGRMGEALWFDSAGELVAAGVDYFGPVARKARRPLAGFSKADVADTTNVVWLDLDPSALANTGDPTGLAAEAERWLEALRGLGLAPSVYVFSGRGSWAYWKLDRHVPQAEAEALMRRLYAQFRPGGSEHDIGRVARMPGSVNEKTGLLARVMAVEDSRWDPIALARLLPDVAVRAARAGRQRAAPITALRPAGRLPNVHLPDDLRRYMASRPGKRDRAAEEIDGSSVEQEIVARLVNAGCSDGQIALFFDHHRLPRHMEEMRTRRGYGWLAMGIASAREPVVSSPTPMRTGKGTLSTGGGARGIGWYARRWVILRDMPDGLRKLELLGWVRETFGIRRSQALRDLDWLEDNDYVAATRGAEDGRVRRVVRTQRAADRLANWRGPGVPFEFVKGLATGRAEKATPEPERKPRPDPEPPPAAPEPTPHGRRQGATAGRAKRTMSNTREAERRRRERALINDVHRIHVPGGRWTYLQLLTPPDEWAYVRLHEQLRVGPGEDGVAVHRSFISPKDDALGGPGADDPVEERTVRDGGYAARDRVIAVAAQLEPAGNGYELATRADDGGSTPNVGLLVQAHSNFFRPLLALEPTGGSAFAARKRGKGKETAYELRAAGDGIEIPAAHGIDLDALLHELADEDVARAVLDSLPDGWRLVKRVPWL